MKTVGTDMAQLQYQRWEFRLGPSFCVSNAASKLIGDLSAVFSPLSTIKLL